MCVYCACVWVYYSESSFGSAQPCKDKITKICAVQTEFFVLLCCSINRFEQDD